MVCTMRRTRNKQPVIICITLLLFVFMFPCNGVAEDNGEKISQVQENTAPTFHQFYSKAKKNLDLLGQEALFVASNYSHVPKETGKALKHLTGDKDVGNMWIVFFVFLLPIAVGWGVEKLLATPVNKYKVLLQHTVPTSVIQLSTRLAARTALDLFSFAVFAAVTVGVSLLLFPNDSPLFTMALVYLPTIFSIRLVYILLSIVYSPGTPHLRIVPQDCSAATLYLTGLISFVILTLFTTRTLVLLKDNTMSEGAFLFLYSLLGVTQFLILLCIVWKDRTRITRQLTRAQNADESQVSSFTDKMTAIWFPLTCIGLLSFELLWQINLILYQQDLILPLLLTILSVPFGFLLFSIGNHLLLIAAGQTELMDPRIVNQDILPEGAEITDFIDVELPPEPSPSSMDEETTEEKKSLLLRNMVLIRNLMAILIGCALLSWIMSLWGFDLQLGRTVVQSALSIFSTLLLAYVVWEVCRTIIDKKLDEESSLSGQDMEDAEEGSEGSRKGTLLTLLRKVLFIFIGLVVILVTLNTVGVNIGPLLAGAGILGIAVGFGSQTLVRDILSGVFFLMDDAFRVGDYIETAGTKGMVEHISLRSLRLRHPRGMVYTIPFGDMGSVQNFSRDYIITKLDVRVRYDADIEKIRKIVKKLGKELAQHEEIGPLLLNPIKSQGVREMDDSAMILRIKFKTKPGDQFLVRREVYRNIQERFQAQGIEFAHRNVTVYMPPETSGADNGEQAQENVSTSEIAKEKLIGAAAAASLATMQPEKPGSGVAR